MVDGHADTGCSITLPAVRGGVRGERHDYSSRPDFDNRLPAPGAPWIILPGATLMARPGKLQSECKPIGHDPCSFQLDQFSDDSHQWPRRGPLRQQPHPGSQYDAPGDHLCEPGSVSALALPVSP